MLFKRLPKWSIVLSAILLITAGSAWLTSQYIAASNGRVTEVHVVAHDWWWEFDYPSQGVKVANVLYVPKDRPVRLVLTSADVIHSFWLPSMRMSVDVVPGQKRTVVLDLRNPGVLNGTCGAACGCNTVCMRFRVLVTSDREFQQWVKKQRGVPLKPGNGPAPNCVIAQGAGGTTPSPVAGKQAAPPAKGNDGPEQASSPASAP